MEKIAVGVLVSGRGSNLRALLEASNSLDFPAQVNVVISNRKSAKALEMARHYQISQVLALPVSEFDGDIARRDRAILEKFRAAGVKLVVCAGYDRVLSAEFMAAFSEAILNVHPSLLPAFGGGMNGVEAALQHGVKVTGCTVQMLEPGITDGGAIVLQSAVPIFENDDVETLWERIHQQEWQILPQAVELWCRGRLLRQDGKIKILDEQLVTPGTFGVKCSRENL